MFNDAIARNKLNESFSEAISKNDIVKIRELFEPLIKFEKDIENGNLTEDEINELSKDVNRKIPFIEYQLVTTTAIMRSAQMENWDMVIELFNLNANVNVNVEPLKWYFVQECIVNAPDNVLYPVLDCADLNVKTNKGQTPLMVAIERNKDEVSNYLVNNEDLIIDYTESDKDFNNYAHYAAKHEKYDLLMKLIENGVPILSKNKNGETPVDLIKDDIFRMSLPDKLESISSSGKNIVFNQDNSKKAPVIKNKKVQNTDNKLKLKGLSSIVKM